LTTVASAGIDLEAWEDEPCPVRRKPLWYEDDKHADKTRPCNGFLASRADRLWDNVCSEIYRRFDKRWLAGRHVTFDHLVDRVAKGAVVHTGFGFFRDPKDQKFYVDDDGILRHNRKRLY
jgi:hypothetical protein